MRLRSFFAVTLLWIGASISPVAAGKADVVSVDVQRNTNGTFRFDVTVRHGDTGWDHYADGWEVVGEDGMQYGYRKLLHPHINEQPFTRSLSGIRIPGSVARVIVRAHDSVDEWGGAGMTVDLPD